MKRFFALILVLLSAGTASAAPAEVRGVHFYVDYVQERDDMIQLSIAEWMKRFADAGLNTVYVGYISPQVFPKEQKPFEQIVIEAHRNGLLVIAQIDWPPYWSTNEDGTGATFIMKQELTTHAMDAVGDQINQSGKSNPFHATVQKAMIEQAIEVVRNYDIDGVQFSFKLGTPIELGYDDYTKQLYKTETGLDVTRDPREENFFRWRTEKLSEFAMKFVTELRMLNPSLVLSTSVNLPARDEPTLVDWIGWTKWCECGGKHWDEIELSTSDANAPIPSEQKIKELGTGSMFVTIQLTTREKKIQRDFRFDDYPDPIASIESIRTGKWLGHSFIYAAYLLPMHEKEITELYDVKENGRARHPLKPANWREPSIPATREGDVFVADLKDGERFHVIVKKDGVWNDIGSFDLNPGRNTFLQEGDALELMVDRRP